MRLVTAGSSTATTTVQPLLPARWRSTSTSPVDMANQVISYTISDVVPNKDFREATIADLAAALVSNSDFAANFSVSYVDPGTDTKANLLQENGSGW